MSSLLRRTVGLFACCVVASACARAGQKIDRAAEKTGKAVQKAGQKTGEGLERAGKKVKEAFD